MKKLLEIGPGRGDFLFHLATENPQATVVGVEVKPTRCEKLAVRLAKRELKNVELVCMDAKVFLPQCAPDEFEQIFILFSDPWPKNRHAKNRLFQEKFVEGLLRVLKPGGRMPRSAKSSAPSPPRSLPTTTASSSPRSMPINGRRKDAR
jgi:tRNA (guanine-N7-)-methyltransferase